MFGRLAAICSRPALSVGDAKIATVTTTLIHADLPVHRPAPVEIWLSTQPYQGRYRGPAAVETGPRTAPENGLQPVPFQ